MNGNVFITYRRLVQKARTTISLSLTDIKLDDHSDIFYMWQESPPRHSRSTISLNGSREVTPAFKTSSHNSFILSTSSSYSSPSVSSFSRSKQQIPI